MWRIVSGAHLSCNWILRLFALTARFLFLKLLEPIGAVQDDALQVGGFFAKHYESSGKRTRSGNITYPDYVAILTILWLKMPDDEAENICPSCGARVPEGEEVCDLCGTPIHSEATPSEKQEGLSPVDAGEANGPYCHQCGWQNPAGARYCSQCGERLQDVSGAAPPAANVKQASLSESSPAPAESSAAEDATSDRKDMRRQVSILVGASLLLIVALFLLLIYNGQSTGGSQAVQPDTSGPPVAMQGPGSGGASAELPAASVLREEEPLPESLASQVGEIRTQIADAEGEEQRTAQRRLINLYIGAGRPDLAALEQEQLAQQEGTVEAWTTTGNLFYGWMQNMEGPRRAAAAEHAIEAYQRVLEEEPDNLDVRTDLATAYLETNNPMQGVQEIKRVLDQNPNHLQGRFNYGIMLTMIGRTEKAIQQFERVQEIAGPESPHTRRAQQIIQRLQQQGSQSGGTSGS